jgi:hypothetical protein
MHALDAAIRPRLYVNDILPGFDAPKQPNTPRPDYHLVMLYYDWSTENFIWVAAGSSVVAGILGLVGSGLAILPKVCTYTCLSKDPTPDLPSYAELEAFNDQERTHTFVNALRCPRFFRVSCL